MLELKRITKRYVSSDTYVDALKGISLTFRNNEFVSILGPSGCGKTTLLNIIGGLDKYTTGDLIIDGVSTKEYSSNDWDNYRNHKIGFVFQSYNLIPHQTILKNVELALTISGVKKKERFERAYKALEKVGLKDLYKKKPNQLSGGQMQRVAIARALVNNPSILLADEPTGALDSETSIQVMDLLKEVASDRLVIMVTHNPDLAYQYSSRIVKMKDGIVLDDSNECKEHDKLLKKEEIVREKQSAMKLKTATGLSFSNLISKLKRTVLITIAGSIGIVGVSSVLAVSTGVKGYIKNMQEDMLSSYPLTIAEESVDLTSLTTGLSGYQAKDVLEFDTSSQVGMDSMIDYLMTTYKNLTNVKTNDINENFLKYLEGLDYQNDVAATNYNYGIDVTNNIYTSWNKDYLDPSEKEIISLNGLTQRYIAELKTVDGFSSYAQYVSLFTDFMKQLPGGEDYILSQYDLLGNSTYANDVDEVMLVVNDDTTFTDLYLAQLGFYDHDEFLHIAKKAIEINKLDKQADDYNAKLKAINEDPQYEYRKIFNYTDLIGKEMYYFPHDSIYQYGEYTSEPEINVVANLTDVSNNEYKLVFNQIDVSTLPAAYQAMIPNGHSIKCYVGDDEITFVRPSAITTSYTSSDKEIMCGSWMGQNENADTFYLLNIPNDVFTNGGITIQSSTSQVDLMSATPSVLTGYPEEISSTAAYYSNAVVEQSFIDNPSNKCTKLKITGILRTKNGKNFGSLSAGVYYTKELAKKYMDDALNSQIISNPTNGMKAYIGSNNEKTGAFECYVLYNYLDYSDTSNPSPTIESSGYVSAINSDLSNSMASLFMGGSMNYYDADTTALRSFAGLKTIELYNDANDENKITGYDFKEYPVEISIYPTSFEAKDNITQYLDKWNQEDLDINVDNQNLKYEDRTEITYSDTIGMIIGVIDVLINTITIALVAFTSLSLLVSCFMIAVITYISVMERVKEIGVIRSLGGRKKDISRLFISETFMTGLFSGLFGVGFTYILCLITNLATKDLVATKIAVLPIKTAIIMITLSIVLSVVSGIIPSMKSAKQDPVTALRSE